MIDVAVVGLGRVAIGFQRDQRRIGVTTHVEAWRRHPMTRLVAGADPDPPSRQAFERDTGLPAYADWSELKKNHSPSIVSVCTRPDAHAAIVLRALQDGAARVVCEKPCTPDLQAIRELRERLGEDSRRVGINFHRRYDPLHRRLFGLAAAQGIRSGSGNYTAGLRNTASHWFDGLFAAGAQVASVLAVPVLEGDDPTPTILVRLASGATVSLHAGSIADYMVYEIDLLLAAGRVRLWAAGSRGSAELAAPSPRFSEYRELRPVRAVYPLGLSNAMLAMADDAVSSLLDDRPMLCTVDDAVKVHTLLDAVDRSMVTGTWIEVQ